VNTTLDEWEILHAVVQLGGFAPAAEQLNRSQSTIGYAIARLQERLGIKLLEVKGRKAQLTDVGRVLLADAEPHLAGFHQLEQRARSLASGGQSEIRLSVDSIFPNDRLFAALSEFIRKFSYVRPKLRHAAFLSSDSEFSAHETHLCISVLMSREYFVKQGGKAIGKKHQSKKVVRKAPQDNNSWGLRPRPPDLSLPCQDGLQNKNKSNEQKRPLWINGNQN